VAWLVPFLVSGAAAMSREPLVLRVHAGQLLNFPLVFMVRRCSFVCSPLPLMASAIDLTRSRHRPSTPLVHLKFSFSHRISARSGVCLQDVFFTVLNHLTTSSHFNVRACHSCVAQDLQNVREVVDFMSMLRCSDFALSTVSSIVISDYLTQFRGQ
jgi:hypothetical protein